MSNEPRETRPVLCGTKKAVKVSANDYRTACATCDKAGSTSYPTMAAANAAAIRISAHRCRTCGAS